MLAGARLAGIWHHTRAHRFFAAARWSADQLGLAVLEMIVACLLEPGAPLRLVVDDTLFRRSGRKVFGSPGTTTRSPRAASRSAGPTAGSW
jgi:SRSO17 transposase